MMCKRRRKTLKHAFRKYVKSHVAVCGLYSSIFIGSVVHAHAIIYILALEVQVMINDALGHF